MGLTASLTLLLSSAVPCLAQYERPLIGGLPSDGLRVITERAVVSFSERFVAYAAFNNENARPLPYSLGIWEWLVRITNTPLERLGWINDQPVRIGLGRAARFVGIRQTIIPTRICVWWFDCAWEHLYYYIQGWFFPNIGIRDSVIKRFSSDKPTVNLWIARFNPGAIGADQRIMIDTVRFGGSPPKEASEASHNASEDGIDDSLRWPSPATIGWLIVVVSCGLGVLGVYLLGNGRLILAILVFIVMLIIQHFGTTLLACSFSFLACYV